MKRVLMVVSGDPGTDIGPALTLPPSQASFARSSIGSVSEIVHSGTIANYQNFPTVVYWPGMQFAPTSSSTTWTDAPHAAFIESSDRTCYYAIRVDGSNIFRTGEDNVINSTSCYSYGDSLW